MDGHRVWIKEDTAEPRPQNAGGRSTGDADAFCSQLSDDIVGAQSAQDGLVLLFMTWWCDYYSKYFNHIPTSQDVNCTIYFLGVNIRSNTAFYFQSRSLAVYKALRIGLYILLFFFLLIFPHGFFLSFQPWQSFIFSVHARPRQHLDKARPLLFYTYQSVSLSILSILLLFHFTFFLM